MGCRLLSSAVRHVGQEDIPEEYTDGGKEHLILIVNTRGTQRYL